MNRTDEELILAEFQAMNRALTTIRTTVRKRNRTVRRVRRYRTFDRNGNPIQVTIPID